MGRRSERISVTNGCILAGRRDTLHVLLYRETLQQVTPSHFLTILILDVVIPFASRGCMEKLL
jgi:hypothetical protein